MRYKTINNFEEKGTIQSQKLNFNMKWLFKEFLLTELFSGQTCIFTFIVYVWQFTGLWATPDIVYEKSSQIRHYQADEPSSYCLKTLNWKISQYVGWFPRLHITILHPL